MWLAPDPSFLQLAYRYVINNVFRNVYDQAINHLTATCIISTLILIILLREYMNYRQRRQQGRPSIAVCQVTQQLIDGTTHPGSSQQQTSDHNNNSTDPTT